MSPNSYCYFFIFLRCSVLTLALSATNILAEESPNRSPAPVPADDSSNTDERIEQLILRVERLEAIIAQQQKALADALAETAPQQPSRQNLPAQQPVTQSLSAEPAVPNTPSTEGDSDGPDVEAAQQIAQQQVENLSLIESAFKRTLVEEGGLLMAPGEFSYVPSVSFIHSSSDRIVVDGFTIEDILVVGDIVSRQVRRDLTLVNNTFRWGVKGGFQLDLQIPYGQEKLQSVSGAGEEFTEKTSGLGDASLALGYQLLDAKKYWPATLMTVNYKSTTGEDPYRLTSSEELSLGTGFESWGVSFTTVSVSDPVVFFSGLSWTNNVEAKKELGVIDVGDSIGAQLGMVFALNLDTSMSFGYQMNAVKKTRINNQEIPGSNLLTSMLSIGVSRILSNNFSTDFQIAVGLTEDSPDVQMSFSFPYQ